MVDTWVIVLFVAFGGTVAARYLWARRQAGRRVEGPGARRRRERRKAAARRKRLRQAGEGVH